MEMLLYLAIPIALAIGIYLGITTRKKAKKHAGLGGGLVDHDGPGFDAGDGGGGGD